MMHFRLAALFCGKALLSQAIRFFAHLSVFQAPDHVQLNFPNHTEPSPPNNSKETVFSRLFQDANLNLRLIIGNGWRISILLLRKLKEAYFRSWWLRRSGLRNYDFNSHAWCLCVSPYNVRRDVKDYEWIKVKNIHQNMKSFGFPTVASLSSEFLKLFQLNRKCGRDIQSGSDQWHPMRSWNAEWCHNNNGFPLVEMNELK